MLRGVNNRLLVKSEQLEQELEDSDYDVKSATVSNRNLVKGRAVDRGNKEIYFPRYAANPFRYNKELFFSVHWEDVEFEVIDDE